MSGKFMKVIRRTIPTLTLIVMASQLFGCGAANQAQILQMLRTNQEITIEYAEPLSESELKPCTLTYSDTEAFRTSFENLVGISSSSSNEGKVSLAKELSSKSFISKLSSISSQEQEQKQLLEALKDVYLDIDSNSSQETIRNASLNAYYHLFADKEGASNMYNSTSRVSRVDFESALVMATSSLDENAGLSCSEIASKNISNQYISQGEKNYSDTLASGKITKIEAIYSIVNTLYADEFKSTTIESSDSLCDGRIKNLGNVAEKQGYDKSKTSDDTSESNINAAVLKYCIENKDSGNNAGLDSELFKALKLAIEKGMITESEALDWNKAVTKDEAIELIINGIVEKEIGMSISEAVSVVSEELANAKNEALSKLEALSHVDTDTYKEQIENGSSIEDIESLISEATSEEESEAERQQAERQQAEAETDNSNNSNNSSSNSGSITISGGFVGGIIIDTPPTSSGNHELEVPPGFTTGKAKDATGDTWEVDPNDQGGIIFK